jgi:hypothetical protein
VKGEGEVGEGTRGGSGGVVPPRQYSADPAGQPEQPQHLVVQHRGRDRAVGHGLRQRHAPGTVRARHGQVQRGQSGGRGAPRGVPVRGDHAVEAPLVLEHVPQQLRVLGHRDAVDLVVSGHDQGRAGLPDTGLERRQVQLAQHVLGDPGVVGPALRLGVVAHEVLDASGDAGALHAADERHPEPGGQHRVLGEALEAAAAERRAHQVDGRRQQHVDTLGPGLGAQRGGELADQARVPGGAEGGRARQAGRGMALVQHHASDPGRAVRCDHRAEPERVGALGAPAVRAGQQQHLVQHRQRGDQRGRVAVRPGVCGSPCARLAGGPARRAQPVVSGGHSRSSASMSGALVRRPA